MQSTGRKIKDTSSAGSRVISGIISSIHVEQPHTWEDKIYLTFDIDWAHDDILMDTLELVEEAGVCATWFVTHDTPLLGMLRANPKFELGIHPNFNFLLQGDDRRGRTAAEVIDRMLAIVPEAKSVRSHSMVQSSVLLDLFKEKGLTHDCNHFIPEHANLSLKPWKHWNGLTRVPYHWEDDVACMYPQGRPVEELLARPGLKVFDFHPIHVYLNTEQIARYERTRPMHKVPHELIQHRHNGEGTRNALRSLIQSCG